MKEISISILLYGITLTGNWLSFIIKKDVWIRIYNILFEIIENHYLINIRYNIWLSLAFIILRTYNDLIKELNKNIIYVINEIQREAMNSYLHAMLSISILWNKRFIREAEMNLANYEMIRRVIMK